jgi:hypothetical protein
MAGRTDTREARADDDDVEPFHHASPEPVGSAIGRGNRRACRCWLRMSEA